MIFGNIESGTARIEISLQDQGGGDLVLDGSPDPGPDFLFLHDADRLLGGQSLVPKNDRKTAGLSSQAAKARVFSARVPWLRSCATETRSRSRPPPACG
jgi:hypothetical protein